MINSVKQAIVDRLVELYPDYTIYDEDIPQNFKKPSFVITLIEQDYNKRINVKFKSLISFDVAYFSPKKVTQIKEDCLNTQVDLLRGFDLMGTYRALNKQAVITDNVLHFTLDVRYSEIISQEYVKMQRAQINERTEE